MKTQFMYKKSENDWNLLEAHKHTKNHLIISLHPHTSLHALTPSTSASHILTSVTMPPQHDKCKQKVHLFITVAKRVGLIIQL